MVDGVGYNGVRSLLYTVVSTVLERNAELTEFRYHVFSSLLVVLVIVLVLIIVQYGMLLC